MQKTLQPAPGFHFSLVLLALCACGDAPRHVTEVKPTSPQTASPHGQAGGPGAGQEPVALATPHGGTGAAPGEPLFAGTLRLEGSLASASTGGIFIIGRNAQSGALSLVRKYEIAEAVASADGTALVLDFTLDSSHGMGGVGAPPAAEISLVLRYDPDGIVETREGQVETSLVVASGRLDLALTLTPQNE